MSATATLEKDATRGHEGAQEARCGQYESPSLYGRARAAAARYLELRGYDVLDRDWPCDDGLIDIVAWDGDELVFVEVQTAFDGFPDDDREAARRRQLEAMALAYLGENEYVDIPVRFDEICIVPVGRDRAFLRHQVNALGRM